MQVDTQRLQQALQEVDPTNPEALAHALEGGVLTPILTPEQQAALIRLENLLALIEGWTELVVKTATESKLAAYPALAESMRRRRAAGGPAENAFAALVGLEIRPKRMRAAFDFWQTLTNLVGHQKRELVWNNLELMPKNDDLDNPVEFAQQVAIQF
jgi:putative hydrolase